MIEWATNLIESVGLAGIALLIALESIFPPIPSELVLLLSGFNVSEGNFNVVETVAFATVGSVVGAWVLYAVGRLIDESRLEALVAGVGKWLGIKRKDVETGFRWFERHGTAVIFFGRLVPIVRSVVSIPAGAERMSMVRFTLWTALGSAVWNTVWICIGWGLGDRWQDAEKWGSWFQYVVAAVIVIGVVVLVARSRRHREA